MLVERCDECGFDGGSWSDDGALDAIGALGEQWRHAVVGLSADNVGRRPRPEMWSIAEYADHVREVLFGMRFVLDIAVEQPGTDLGPAPEPAFTSTPKAIELPRALDGIGREAGQLVDRLRALSDAEWRATVTIDGQEHDAHWICRHAVHDARHHLLDVERLRAALTES